MFAGRRSFDEAMAVHGNPEAMDAFVSVVAGTLSPAGLFDPAHIGRVMSAAAAP